MPTPDRHPSPWREPEHDDLADLARTFFTKEVLPHADRLAAQGHPDREHYRRAGELGLLGLSVPEQYGGGGGGFTHEAVVLQEQAYAGEASLGLAVHSGIVTGYLVAYGSDEQKRRWLPGLCSGELVGAIAMTEPDGGSDLQAMRTRAVRDGDDYVVTGAKTFISNGGLADLIIVAVKTDPEQRAAGISLLVCDVSGDPEGFRRGRLLAKIGLHANDTAELFFDGLRVPAANLLGDAEGLGFVQLMQQLPQERLVLAVGAVAAMERAVELTVAYTKARTAFGKPLLGHQNTRMVLAECATRARTGRVFLDDCVARHARGELDVATAAMAKYWLTEGQCEVIDRCLQLFGGYGYTTEYPIARMYADARAQKIYGGTNEIMKELIARAL
ncbi:acyl-CoA dehydrogenase family protein [Micromonospora sp. WMMD812]|uniref:acyl-CoA dehydrogenase family protein n=1 Tax=Micromonospora sp. WMMD812 TaxID=3015152 RepID=UPI00248ABB38|nr:acyl-CoA dehydrogenase family protein [Micromonospora sp. WMMD812]WBB65255.1 acyl-CoA dehydrogenase family protein [Micromonospora sp. WMMD812]